MIYFLLKIVYKAITFSKSFANKYRAGYYSHVYGKQVLFSRGVKLGGDSSIIISPGALKAKLIIGENTRFLKFCTITLDDEGVLQIGENTFFNNRCSLNCLGNIKIGSNTLFGEGVKIYDHNHIFNKKDTYVENQGFRIGCVSIGDNCWIGSNVLILKDVIIGDNVVVGAGCIVTSSIASNTIVRYGGENVKQEIVFN